MSSPTALWLLAVGLVILTIGFILCGIPNPWQAGTADGATASFTALALPSTGPISSKPCPRRL